MPRRTKDAPGRVTPKGGADAAGRSVVSGRYTAPLPVEYRRSATWVPVTMLVFFAAGILMIILNYLGLLPGATSNWYLLGGLGLMVCGFVVATQYR